MDETISRRRDDDAGLTPDGSRRGLRRIEQTVIYTTQ